MLMFLFGECLNQRRECGRTQRGVITIIYHDSFLSVSEKYLFENQLSMEMRFCLTTDGHVLECNRNGKVMVDRYGDSFLNFFSGKAAVEAKNYLETIIESHDIVAVLLGDRAKNGSGLLFNGMYKNQKIYLTGYDTSILDRQAAEFAHELRNPLTVIKGFVQLSGYTQDFEKYQETILAEIDRMHAILENFLTFSRKKLKKERVHPEQICSAIISFISSECMLKKVDFDYDVVSSTKHCTIDFQLIKQVMLNVLRNALESFDEGQEDRRLYFRGSIEDDGYRFALSDNGKGIESSVLQKLGEPFFTTKTNGTGIGLALCKKIIAEHHGSFCISSVPDKGTTVSFLLPFDNDA